MSIRKHLVMAALAGASVSARAAAEDVQAQVQVEAPPSPEPLREQHISEGLPPGYATPLSGEARAYALQHFRLGPVMHLPPPTTAERCVRGPSTSVSAAACRSAANAIRFESQ